MYRIGRAIRPVWRRLGSRRRWAATGIGQSAGPLSISLHGRYLTRVQAGPRRQRLVMHYDRVDERGTLITTFVTADWHMSLDGRFVVYNDSTGAVYLHDLQVAPDGLLPTADADGDGLPNGWEEQFGLKSVLGVVRRRTRR
jgi:hypothetical protein